ncbi:lysine-specific demethylase JMJ30 isoform X2 [Prosopis cineraria]|uniref:lysine-specific demethylase JMJ30 isoform X2 n=1 Tax=Prosopis cineraria TaxID=364024 RepID=UPI00240F5B60|nr:lysine-specific demethylase JMJ30 isoform X2 [Prosopis cineraria]
MSSSTAPATTSDSSDLFETPILDSEFSALLHAISEHGGYAFVSMATLATLGDFRAAEAAREMAWEQLHSGPRHSVLPVWRDAYSMACLHVAKHHYSSGDFKEALRALDMGLIMGGSLLKNDLSSAVGRVSERVRNIRASGESHEGFGKSEQRLLDHELNQAEVYKLLPLNSLSHKIVEKRSALSLERFLEDYYRSGSPVIISDCMAHWPAKTKWNDIDYLKRIAGDRTIPVEVGKNHLCAQWKKELITFSEFLQRIESHGCSSVGPTYLAQHPLFDQINELRKDICIPDYCFAGEGELRCLNAWFGPAGIVTPLHHDPHHHILAQVVGKKYVRLYSASLSKELYPYIKTTLTNSSQIDPDSIDEKMFPGVQDLEFVDCILEEGELLYIPQKWWHYVRSLTTSFSVSFRWSKSEGSATS